MRKFISTMISTALIAGATLMPAYAQTPISVVVDGTPIEFDVAPFIENDRTLVPVRGVFEAMGAEVLWDADARAVTILKGADEIYMEIDSTYILKNLNANIYDTTAKIVDDRTFIPLRAVSELLDCDVAWDESTKTVNITCNALPFDVEYVKDEEIIATSLDGYYIKATYTYPAVTDGKGFLSAEASEKFNSAAKEISYSMYDLAEYASTFHDFEAVADTLTSSSGYVEIDVKTTVTASDTYDSISLSTNVYMPWTGMEMKTKTFDNDTFEEYTTMGKALKLPTSESCDQLHNDIYAQFQELDEYARYGREYFDEDPLENIHYTISGDKMTVSMSYMGLVGVGRTNWYLSVVHQLP